MNPIINPCWFYIYSLAGNLKNLFLVVGLIYLIITIFVILVGPACFDELPEKYIKWFFHKWLKKGVPIAILSFLIAIFIPSEKTCYQMMVAAMTTEDNVNYTEKDASDLIDHIINKVDAIIDKEKED